ncbi:uncharacterized protein PODANS_2_10860 [Podospora anserina S mat+]|uniref:Cytokinesis protein 3 n=1 Tax=Podospora anserina (strain S / ATCC MYA-4624 / DSM 980 / FGSC 10383) TaxID=515849 RepID=B2B7E8_PODAN|nr:uncharacterized protein PODANS_2_10860 [Podospora anserina S mat+]CAP73726.1 unnamed protein product [Podospora anserina S mat+]CDP26127.1 Putative Cytokinesis protein 3 [Podospora anserina S mat+]
MVPAPLPLPTRFPCWVRAVYSWGGESKRDLGFIEGDLIECLNAGDGSWWTGRLFRDRRAVGLFPSNFVEVLPETFRPTTRSTSPLPNGNTPSPKHTPQKSRTFRKPFEAYAKAPHYTTAKVPETFRDGYKKEDAIPVARSRDTSVNSMDNTSPVRPSTRRQREISPAPPSNSSYNHRAPSPAPTHHQNYGSRSPSPMPEYHHGGSRAPSPAPPQHHNYISRSPSPAPPQDVGYNPRAISPAPPHHGNYDMRAASPAPPHHGGYDMRAASPAPPHHGGYDMRAASPAPLQHNAYGMRAASPAPPQHGGYGMRAASPAPPQHHAYDSRAPSPAPPQDDGFDPRAPSPTPSYIPYRPPEARQQSSFHQSVDSTMPSGPPLSHRHHVHHMSLERHNSPAPPQHGRQHTYHLSLDRNIDRSDSPPPPPPPPHRTKVTRQESQFSQDEGYFTGISREQSALSRGNSNASYGQGNVSRHHSNVSYEPPQQSGFHTPRTLTTPCPPSPGIDGLTPSPLREAMDDVMEQLDALGAGSTVSAGREPSPEPPVLDPWSPASFDMVHARSRKERKRTSQLRPNTSMGIPAHIDEGYETNSGTADSSVEPTPLESSQEPHLPQLSNYVERMESRLRTMHQHNASVTEEDEAPPPPPKSSVYDRPKSSMGMDAPPEQKLRHKKSGYEGVGRNILNRTFTTKTNSTNSSSNTQSTDRSLMSGVSAGGISATSAGSLARKNRSRAHSALGLRELLNDADSGRPETPFSGVTYHSSHASDHQNQQRRSKSQLGFTEDPMPALPGLGGLVTPKPKKQNFIKRILESAKTGVASTRGSIAAAGASTSNLSSSNRSTPALTSMSSAALLPSKMPPPRDMGMGGGVDWVQVRRDINRSNSLSFNEKVERKERCQMLDYPALDPVDELYSSIDGDEGADGMPVAEPTNYHAINLSQVDKNSRFLTNLAPTTTAITLATTFVCRPYRSDVQRLRAIFTWVAEHICWEEDFEGEVDTRQVIQSRRGCAEEYAVLVLEMCAAVGLGCEVVRGYLKTPGEIPEVNIMPRSNHWWNAVLVDNEWRFMDCCLASPSNPKRALYSSHGSSSADPWWFLVRPSELCWTHIPEHHAQQHLCPPVAHETLLNLPCACPPFFKNDLQMVDYNTSLVRIEDLEMVHVKFNVPPDVEVAAEVEVRAYSRDMDGDLFESGDVVKKRALAQADWHGSVKRYTVKALLPGDEGTGVLKIYAGKRGLMHSIKDIPHPLAFALPVIHTGENPPYEFVTRHPTPHAQRHDIYVVQPQCQRLALNNTFVFAIRQHPSSAAITPVSPAEENRRGGASPIPFMRPGSAMSMTSSAAGSMPSTTTSNSSGGSSKPAKLAIQTPGGKILRLMRKEERRGVGIAGKIMSPSSSGLHNEEGVDAGDGGLWETIIKCSERGVWRGLVLADRTARWCVFAEWVCEG